MLFIVTWSLCMNTTFRLISLLALLLPTCTHANWQHQEAAIMGTVITVELWQEDAVQGKSQIASVMREMRRIDHLMSSYKAESELSAVNAGAASGPVTVSQELLALIERALEYSKITTGAFDITYASAGQHYDYRNNKKPDAAQLQAALPAIDFHHVKINKSASTVAFMHPGVRIDLGGIAKGYAVDRGMKILQQAGVTTALISAGGDTRVIGKRQDRPWNIGIRNPRNGDNIVSMIPLENSAVSTSGDYERFFEEDGVRYHHILDPKTGTSTHEIISSSIIGEFATDTDALSTSVFILGVEKGMQLIDSIANTEAVIIDNKGDMHYSAGLARAQ
jgi:thiamine biosynthesis lipoprotein